MPCPRPGRGMLMRISDRKRGLRPEAPYIFFDSTWPPVFSQAFVSLAMVKPWPLQSFLPLQSWAALLHAPFPLQSFAPSQCTVPFAAFLPAKATAGAMNVASAPAIATPFNVPLFIFVNLLLIQRLLPEPSGLRTGTAVRLRMRQAAAQQYYARTRDRVSDERRSQRVASARLAPLPAGQTPALFDEPDPLHRAKINLRSFLEATPAGLVAG